MIRRPLRVQFRLTPAEYAQYMPLIEKRHLWTWSDLVRVALKEFWTRSQQPASDNGVRREDLPSDSQTKRSSKAKKAPALVPAKSRKTFKL